MPKSYLNQYAKALLLGLFVFNISCTHVSTRYYDSRSFSILSYDLYDQMTSEAKKDLAWKGNWLLRRKRLEVIDFELRKVKPDILAFQNVMNRMESPSESDINILSFGSLRGYSWKSAFIKNYAETGEDKFQSLAVSLPLRFQQVGNDVYSWPLGVDGFLSMYELFLVDRPILVFNVSMPKSTENVDVWYEFLATEIERAIEKYGTCNSRIVVAGYLPGHLTWKGYNDFISRLELKDTSTEFCSVESDCYTQSLDNQLYAKSQINTSDEQAEKILVHESALIEFGEVVLKESVALDQTSAELFKLSRLNGSISYAWYSSVRLTKCE